MTTSLPDTLFLSAIREECTFHANETGACVLASYSGETCSVRNRSSRPRWTASPSALINHSETGARSLANRHWDRDDCEGSHHGPAWRSKYHRLGGAERNTVSGL